MPPCKTQELVALCGYSLSLIFSFYSQYMLHHGAGYTRLHQSDGVLAGWEAKVSQMDMINCFYFLSEMSTAVMVGYFVFLLQMVSYAFQLVSMILLPPFGRPRRSAMFINDHRECA
ncbi:hypothetical protein N7475_002231 [Penicillium sp. IBT 31633x]|nr:hypothetical protein N7475_002231 [Penicillium sp. IBT 31633x]